MGAASYNRGTRAIIRDADARIATARASKEARALLWRDLLGEGYILSFAGPGGAMITAGPNRVAVPGQAPPCTAYRDHGDARWRGRLDGSAWACALFIIEHAGRARPYRVLRP